MDLEQSLINRIVVSRNVCHGKPRIAGTRILVYQMLDLLAAGKTTSEITTDYFPDITAEDILACIEYGT